MSLKMISTSQAPKAIGPYSQAIQMGNMLYTSGQIPLTVEGELVGEGIEEQTHQVFKNLKAVLNEVGATFNDVVKVGIFLQDMNHFSKVNEIYGSYFQDHKPARSTVEVQRLPKDVLIEIDLISSVPVE